jgi:hypothetical protein
LEQDDRSQERGTLTALELFETGEDAPQRGSIVSGSSSGPAARWTTEFDLAFRTHCLDLEDVTHVDAGRG